MKKVVILFTSIFLFFSLILGCFFGLMSANMTKSALAAETDITKLSTLEQEKVNEQIKKEWGTPSHIRQLSDGFNAIPDSDIQSEVWYYLARDITTDCEIWMNPKQNTTQHVRIVMNGYTISGRFYFNVSGSNAKLSIFDKIPGFTGLGYQYKSKSEKYYRYDSTTGVYSLALVDAPAGCVDVTDMPTYVADTYIRVDGSAFSTNGSVFNSDKKADIRLASEFRSAIAVYGVNFVGVRAFNVLVTENGSISAVGCTFLGNVTGNALIGVFGGKTNLIGNKVYGNRTSESTFGVRASNHSELYRAWDIYMRTDITQYYKNNVGAIYDSLYSIKAIWIKGVDFNRVLTNFELNKFQDVLNCNGMSGTIELVYGLNVTYSMLSPNLSFIVHGGDNKVIAPFRGFNSLKIEKTAVIASLTTAFEEQISSGNSNGNNSSGDSSNSDNSNSGTAGGNTSTAKIVIPSFTIEGRVEKGLSSPGEVIVYGYAVIAYGQAVGTLKNYGELKIWGSVSDLENYGTISLYESKILVDAGEDKPQEAIIQGAVVYNLKNSGTATFNGESHVDNDIINYSNGVVTLNDKSYVYHEVQNEGTITLNGSTYIAGLKNNVNGKAVVGSKIGYLEFNGGDVTITSSNVRFCYIGILKIPAGASFTIGEGVEFIVNKTIYDANNSNKGIMGDSGNANSIFRIGEQFVLESVENNGLLNIAGSFVDITNLKNNTTLNILPTGRVIVYKNQTIGGIIHNDGVLNLADTPNTIARTDFSKSIGQLQGAGLLNIEQNVSYTVAANETFTNRINNDGTLTIEGIVEDITGSGETHIIEGGSAKVVVDKEVSGSINTAGNLIVDGKVNSIISALTANLLVSRTGIITTLNTSGQSVLEERATVNELSINNGYTKASDLTVVKNVTIYDGTFEISGLAKVSRVVKPYSTGTIIDHRKPFITTVTLISVVAGLILFAILALSIIILCMRKNRKKSKAEVETADLTRLLAIKLAKATKYTQKDRLLQDRNQKNIVVRKTDV